ncbi:S9 family peptidase [Streptomyces sp. UNOC14_S4]|uniref:S9 family peptidase n=1 Tax=Streptomyces sp. UNOC14_S4 TaxID=2872340 RepID=UPI001E38E23D|nr:S9 family peptidase [Streptomyces sp. UNOC14_S4]MCC3767144.1 S9 family peptidase [Streptomyces sp. UNOC14_S4]
MPETDARGNGEGHPASVRTVHGDRFVDEFAWLAARDRPEVLAHLRSENVRTERSTAHLEGLRDAVFAELKAAARPADLSVPVRKGGYWYYSRSEDGAPYRVHCRVPATDGGAAPDLGPGRPPPAGECVVLDENAVADEYGFFAPGGFEVSADGTLLVYAADHTGAERFVLRTRNLVTGATPTGEIRGTSGDAAWSGDRRSLFYVALDGTGRPHRVWRRHLDGGTPDVLVLEEKDPRFRLSLGLTRSGQYVLIESRSRTTNEVRYVPADRPGQGPCLIGGSRREGVRRQVEHQGGRFLVLHNDGAGNAEDPENAEDFVLDWAPVEDPTRLRRLVEHRADTLLTGVDAFEEHVVVAFRRSGLSGLMVLPDTGEPWEVAFPEPLHSLTPEANPEYRTRSFRLRHASLATPDTVYSCDLDTGALTPLRRRSVRGDFDPARYVQRREWAVAADGTRVPVSLVARADVPRDGSAPLLLAGYGSYGTSVDPCFSVSRLSLLDRGFVFAVAHVRGGGELGHRWHEGGRLLRKPNGFTDFVACAEHLAATGWTRRGRIVARGGAAGGLLVAAAARLAPGLFAGIVAEAPFVDPLASLLDPARPLTAAEREEWGDPLADPAVYRCVKAYSPYENVTDDVHPPVLATAGLDDPRVPYHQPAKWIARLRATARGGPFLLRTALEAGHAGPSGRHRAWREEAATLAWVIDAAERAGRGDRPGPHTLRAPGDPLHGCISNIDGARP